jgi:hypothetical protein
MDELGIDLRICVTRLGIIDLQVGLVAVYVVDIAAYLCVNF